MPEYKIGYGKPPQASRFKPGKSGNPKGRPKKQSCSFAEIIDGVMSATITYRVNGRTKSASREEVMLKTLIESAMKSDVGAADHVLKMYAHARRVGSVGSRTIQIQNWLPDHGGQTADQNSEASTEGQNATDTIEWWNDPEQLKRRSK